MSLLQFTHLTKKEFIEIHKQIQINRKYMIIHDYKAFAQMEKSY